MNENIIILTNGESHEALRIHDVLGQSEQLCDCGKPVQSAYEPCCSLTCWCEMFEGA